MYPFEQDEEIRYLRHICVCSKRKK